jgi:hypothetical protein
MKTKIIIAIIAVILIMTIGLAYAVSQIIISAPVEVTPVPTPTITPVSITDNGVITTSPVNGDTITLSTTIGDTSSSYTINGITVTFLTCPTQTGTYTSLGTAITNSVGIATIQTVIGSSNAWIEAEFTA